VRDYDWEGRKEHTNLYQEERAEVKEVFISESESCVELRRLAANMLGFSGSGLLVGAFSVRSAEGLLWGVMFCSLPGSLLCDLFIA